jgi:hypothetical protein
MKTPVTIIEIYSDGTIKKYDTEHAFIVRRDDFDEVSFTKSHATKKVEEISGESDYFYELVYALNFTKTIRYTPKRAKQLRTRLKTFTEDEIMKAAQGIFDNEFLQGENPQGKRYGTIDYLLRSDEIIDSYVNETANSIIDLTKIEI